MNSITINGKTFTSNGNLTIINGCVYSDGKTLENGLSHQVTINGNCGNLNITGSVTVNGSVNGDIDCGGSCHCGDVDGNVDAGGSISCDNVTGNIDAGGSVKIVKR